MSIKKDRLPQQTGNSQDSISVVDSNEEESTANKLLKFAGTWEGDDFEQCLERVYKTRGEAKF